jgi:hypothetical protein
MKRTSRLHEALAFYNTTRLNDGEYKNAKINLFLGVLIDYEVFGEVILFKLHDIFGEINASCPKSLFLEELEHLEDFELGSLSKALSPLKLDQYDSPLKEEKSNENFGVKDYEIGSPLEIRIGMSFALKNVSVLTQDNINYCLNITRANLYKYCYEF